MAERTPRHTILQKLCSHRGSNSNPDQRHCGRGRNHFTTRAAYVKVGIVLIIHIVFIVKHWAEHPYPDSPPSRQAVRDIEHEVIEILDSDEEILLTHPAKDEDKVGQKRKTRPL